MGRGLTPGELVLARGVFGEAIDYGAVQLLQGSFGDFAVTLGSRVFFPRAAACEDWAAAPLARQAWLIHELTHVWQFQTAPLRTVASWATTLIRGGYGPGLAGYRYELPVRFAASGLERQAKIVEHAFRLRQGDPARDMPRGAGLADYAGVTPFSGLA